MKERHKAMFNHDFYQPVSVEEAPPAHRCEWCGEPAVYRLTALGGARHNEAGFFCRECGEAFIRIAADSLGRARITEVPYPLVA